MKLFLKGVIGVFIGTTVVAVLVFVFSFFTFRNILRQSVGAEQSLVTRQAFQRVEQFLYWRYMQAKLLGTSIIYKDLLSGKKVSSADAELATRGFQEFNGPWDVIIVADKSGKIVFSSDAGKNGENIKDNADDLPGFQAAAAGEFYYSDIVLSDETSKPTMIFAVPVRAAADFNSKIIGAVIAQLNWQSVLEILEDVKGLDLTLYNRDGYLIGSNNIKRQGDVLKVNSKNLPAFNFFVNSADDSAVLPSLNGDYQALTTHFREAGYLDFAGNDWILAGEAPANQAFALAGQAALYESLILIAMVALSGVILLMYIARFIVRPIAVLNKVAQNIAAGDYSKRAKISTKDEIGDLAQSFNSMAETLTEAPAKLELTVKQRTRELNKKVIELEDSRKAILNVAEDLEEEKNNLQKEKAKDEAILKSMGDGVFVVDGQGRIVLFNKAAENISGFKSKEIVGKHYSKILRFMLETNGKINDEFIKKALATGQVVEMANHTVLMRKDGSGVAVADSAAPVSDREGKIFGCVVIFRDVSKEREIDRAKTEFVSLASHQLRTPLTAIKWYLEMLLEGGAGKLNKKQLDYAGEVYNSNERMIDLVNALLNVSRIEMGTFGIEPKEADIIKIAQETVSEISGEVKKKHLKFLEQYGKGMEKMMLDRNLTHIVIQNLLANAVRYTLDGGKISFAVEKQDKNILIIVSDTGIGIPRRQQERIFEKLFRADNAREQDTTGTGLGLYVVKSIVDKAGGRVWFESIEGRGSTFYVELPISGMKKIKGEKKIT